MARRKLPPRQRIWSAIVLIALAFLMLSCQPSMPEATPTATRTPILPTATPTPIPTSTPTATPTITPTPTPTLPPGLILGGDATPADACPPSPADLYFLREGRLWVCLAEGGLAEETLSSDTPSAAEPNADYGFSSYQVSANRRYVTTLSQRGQVSVFDRALQKQTVVPTAGRTIDANGSYVSLVDNAQELIYLGWGVQIDPGPALPTGGSGMIFSVDVMSPTLRQRTLGTCAGAPGRPCAGFLIAPDESRIAVADGEGVWLLERAADQPAGDGPSYLALRPEGPMHLHSWSPDGRWLLLAQHEVVDSDLAPAYALLSIGADRAQISFQPICAEPCDASVSWVPSSDGDKLWLAWRSEDQGCIASVSTADLVTGAVAVLPENRICEAQSLALRPASPLAGPGASALGGVVAFLQDAGPGIASGIYALDAQAALRGVALLPEQPTKVLWGAGGEVFLTLGRDGEALRLGVPYTASLWNVEGLLSGAHDFTWRRVAQE
ncbi:MAG: hypothetical protein JXC32_19645 [Anaerolineae bacterium]|nr:hypothetical protein [Anaerolineae bacterium]